MVQESKRHWQRLEQNAQKQQKVRPKFTQKHRIRRGIDCIAQPSPMCGLICLYQCWPCVPLLHCSLSISPTPAAAAAAAYLGEALGEWGAAGSEGSASEGVVWPPWGEWAWLGWEVHQEEAAPLTWRWSLCVASAGEKDRSASLTRTWSTAQPKRGTGESAPTRWDCLF